MNVCRQVTLPIVFCLISTIALAQSLSCHTVDERAAMKQAPNGAQRIGKHTLEINYKKGSKRFVDNPPHNEYFGLHWRYCGYDSQTKVHLIGMDIEDLFSGQILFEDTGKLLRAGHTILFSPNRENFLAIEQPDGMYTELWSVYDISGKTIWTSQAGTMKQNHNIDSGLVESTFEDPRWNPQGELTARVVCNLWSSQKVAASVVLRLLASQTAAASVVLPVRKRFTAS